MRKIYFLFLLVLILISTVPANAVTITFGDLNIQKGVKILIYNSTGGLIGEYNTTDTVSLNSSGSYIFILKPSEQVWFTNPLNALELFKTLTPAVLSYLLFAMVIIGTGYLITRVLR